MRNIVTIIVSNFIIYLDLHYFPDLHQSLCSAFHVQLQMSRNTGISNKLLQITLITYFKHIQYNQRHLNPNNLQKNINVQKHNSYTCRKTQDKQHKYLTTRCSLNNQFVGAMKVRALSLHAVEELGVLLSSRLEKLSTNFWSCFLLQ